MGIEPILQLTCRDRNRIALQGDLMGAAALGIRNLLLLTGDDPKAGDQPDTKPVFDVNSSTLIETARRLRDEGTLPTGRKVGGNAAFFIGAADMPIDPPAGWQPNALAAKVKSGAQFAQTQFCMDAGDRAPLCGRARTSRADAEARRPDRRHAAALGQVGGLDEKPSVRHHHFRCHRSSAWKTPPIPSAKACRICVELIAELATIPGIAGAHIMAPGNAAAIPEVIAAVRGRVK